MRVRPRKTLLFDCDGPMAGFSTGWLSCLEEETGYSFGEAVVTNWSISKSPFFLELAKEIGREADELSAKVWKRVTRIGFCAALPVVAGAKEAIGAIREFADVEVVTSPLGSSPTWMPERVEWLGRHFGFASEDVHFISKKWRVGGELLLDDKTSHIREWRDEVGGQSLIWDAPYNRDEVDDCDLVRVASWPEVLAYAKGFCS